MPSSEYARSKPAWIACAHASLVVVIAVAFWTLVNCREDGEVATWLRPNALQHLGCEYINIAWAVYEERGFSDPFGEPTGPTAWMPPVCVYAFAACLAATAGDLPSVIVIVRLLSFLAIVASTWTIVRVARRLRIAFIGYLVVLLALFANFYYLFQTTSDIWLRLLIYNLMFVGFCRGSWNSSWKTRVAWGAFGGFCALSCPVAGATWAGTVVVLTVRDLRSHPESDSFVNAAGRIGLLALTALLVVSPWIIRNRLVLDAWIPVKSNLAYEALQSQVLDLDGVLDPETLTRHPSVDTSDQRRRYVESGEVAFVRDCWPPFLKSVESKPFAYLYRVANRFSEACVFSRRTPNPRIASAAFSIITLISVMIVFCSEDTFTRPEVGVLLCLCGFSLLPHILIGCSERYGASLVMIKALLVLFAFDAVRKSLHRRIQGSASLEGKRQIQRPPLPCPRSGIAGESAG